MSSFVVAALPVVCLFREPETRSEVVSQMIYGTRAQVEPHGTAAPQAWLRVRTADAYTGWLQAAQVASEPLSGAAIWVVSQNSANVYPSPGVRQMPLLHLPWESRLAALSTEEHAKCLGAHDLATDEAVRWMPLRLLDGRVGFVMRGNVAEALPQLPLPQSMAQAHRFLGVTYTWGGVSSFGFDCSGFVQMIFRHAGVALPRDAAQQAACAQLRTLETADPLAGDVFFFGTSNLVDHVAVCLGGSRFLHATTQGHPGVQINSVDEPFWRARLLVHRRLHP